jgi:hypothetical protein
MNTINAKSFISNLIANGEKDKDKLIGLTLVEGFTLASVLKAIKDLGLTKRKSEGLTYPDVLEYLESEVRTEVELANFILENCTKNEARWFNDRNKIRSVTNAIHLKYNGNEFKDEYLSKEMKNVLKDRAAGKEPQKKNNLREEAIKKAWENLNEFIKEFEAGIEPNKGRVHPDKIESLKDDELYKAYTKAFQRANNERKKGKKKAA